MDRLMSLTVFGRVVEAGGFSAAARRLNMSVTMVSNHVQALEDRLGARLLNRTTRKVSLTEIGQAYYERAIQVLADLEEADRIAGALHATPRGTLRLHTSMPVVRFLTPVMGESVAEGAIGTWTKKAGDAVRKDEVLVEIETDKVAVEVSSPADGVLAEILAPNGATVTPGQVIAKISTDGKAVASAPAAAPAHKRRAARCSIRGSGSSSSPPRPPRCWLRCDSAGPRVSRDLSGSSVRSSDPPRADPLA